MTPPRFSTLPASQRFGHDANMPIDSIPYLFYAAGAAVAALLWLINRID